MKVHVVNKGEEHIEGYAKVQVDDNLFDMSEYSNNECSFILASDFVDMFPHHQLADAISVLRTKMRMGSTAIIGGTDLRLLARSIMDGSLDTATLNEVLYNKKSISNMREIEGVVEALGLNIVTTKLAGIHYEFECSRE